MKSAFWTVFALSGVGLFVPVETESRKQLVDRVDAYYQAQFADLALVKTGRFGTSRIETSKIKSHLRKNGPSHFPKDRHFSVSIYGSRGKRLDPATVENRYFRWQESKPKGKMTPKRPANWPKDWVRKAARQFASGNLKPYIFSAQPFTIEARPVVLSKPECVSCHGGTKLGDPVAMMVYEVAPFANSKPIVKR